MSGRDKDRICAHDRIELRDRMWFGLDSRDKLLGSNIEGLAGRRSGGGLDLLRDYV